MSDYLPSGLPPFKDILQSYHCSEEPDKREMAVICALELIRVNTLGQSAIKLREGISMLDGLADTIQEALNKD
ncbi:hypothetical protein BS333_06950 [Vibrio azureus]|uniref:Uncharacterized protein n=1 Tax=Vibrio azureus NBRC 104587 TaxID=1219077 RepID=U3C5K0_9VIBR|nr:hypothetical protein [Vibrio azureus]AUI86144.1 hypothetical protein BS333_06950 [Vibrio azureus]GAD76689.1 hypothetical protein VAZ01S_050_00010 [Vibrio azureus NBRC 104587]